jgi:hypothetical protein
MLALAGSAGVHAALIPAHADEMPAVALLFALSAAALGGLAIGVDRDGRLWPVAAAAILLGSLLALYAVSRVAVVWPLTHAEAVDAIGAVTKLLEVAGLWLALRLIQARRQEGARS